MHARPARPLAYALLGAVLSYAASWQHAQAQSYPDKPVKLVVAFPAGGPADVLGRILAEKLGSRWGQPVVVENRGGAGGNVAAAWVARTAPDGYTLLLNASSHVINASLSANLTYDALKDFTPISELASYMIVVAVHPSVPAKTLEELVAFARTKPSGLTVANAGPGTPTHLAAVLFAQAAGVNFVHLPYRGAALATNDVVAGHVPAMFINPVNAVPQANNKLLRILAVTGSKRMSLLPDVPTIAERGYPGFETRTWFGLWGPANLAPEKAAKVSADVKWALNSREVVDKLEGQGWDVVASSPAAFSAVLESEYERWAAVIKSAKITRQEK